jgi:DNA-binding MarR family transcriptional regulator
LRQSFKQNIFALPFSVFPIFGPRIHHSTLAKDSRSLLSVPLGRGTARKKSCTTRIYYGVYASIRAMRAPANQSGAALFELPCACQNLRRLTRVVTRIYDLELRKAGLEITQFGLLTALATAGEVNQKRLSGGFAMDSTTLTRTLKLLRIQRWVGVRPGKDKRERLFSLTPEGKQRLEDARPYWERAEQRLRQEVGHADWKSMNGMVSRLTRAAVAA